MPDIDVIVTEEEQKAIRSLERLAKKWPESLDLFGWAGTLCIVKTGKDGRMCCIPANVRGICCDGGDPSDDEVHPDPEIEWE